MSLTALAVLLVGIWLVLIGAETTVSDTLTLIFGIVVCVLVVFDNLPAGRVFIRERRE